MDGPDDDTLLDIAKGLNIYYSMFLIIFGSVCNILSIIVLSKKAYKRTTFSIYFRFLATVDLFTLYTGLIRHFITATFDYNIRYSSEIFCKIHQWTAATSPDISAWVLVAMTAERVISIIKPLQVHRYFTRKSVILMLLAIYAILLACNLPLLFNNGDLAVTDANNTTTIQKCVGNRPEMNYFMEYVWYWIDLAKFVILPSFILSILNTVIILSVVRSRKRILKFLHPPSGGSNCEAASRITVPLKETSLTLTLLVVNITFMILNSPVSIYLIGRDYWFEPGFKPKERLVYTCCIMALYTNNAANFLLYCATGSKFRTEIGKILRCSGSKCCKGQTYCCSPLPQTNRQTVATIATSAGPSSAFGNRSFSSL